MSCKLIPYSLAAVFVFGAAALVHADDYGLDPTHTAVSFQVSHLGISWTHGRFNQVEGQFSIDPANPADAMFAMAINADSIDTGNQQRDDHLRSPDYFNTKQFPTISFKSTKAEKVEEGIQVTGDMTMHGQTKAITFLLKGGKTATFPQGVERMGFSTSLKIKRSDFGMSNMLEAIGDEIFIGISFEGVKK
ncbi:MAG: YceI family protein [Pirellulaceae bacterium]|nr:YceI family protein [Planctomycetales bacterium]